MNIILTPEERKKLVTDVAIQISPNFIDSKSDSLQTALNISIYAYDIANAVSHILEYGPEFKK
jgi:hypothetical protein